MKNPRSLTIVVCLAVSAVTLNSCGAPGASKDEVLEQQIPPLGELPPLPTSYFPPPPTPEKEEPKEAPPSPEAPPTPPTPSSPDPVTVTSVTVAPPPPAPAPAPAPAPNPVDEAIDRFVDSLPRL